MTAVVFVGGPVDGQVTEIPDPPPREIRMPVFEDLIARYADLDEPVAALAYNVVRYERQVFVVAGEVHPSMDDAGHLRYVLRRG